MTKIKHVDGTIINASSAPTGMYNAYNSGDVETVSRKENK